MLIGDVYMQTINLINPYNFYIKNDLKTYYILIIIVILFIKKNGEDEFVDLKEIIKPEPKKRIRKKKED